MGNSRSSWDSANPDSQQVGSRLQLPVQKAGVDSESWLPTDEFRKPKKLMTFFIYLEKHYKKSPPKFKTDDLFNLFFLEKP